MIISWKLKLLSQTFGETLLFLLSRVRKTSNRNNLPGNILESLISLGNTLEGNIHPERAHGAKRWMCRAVDRTKHRSVNVALGSDTERQRGLQLGIGIAESLRRWWHRRFGLFEPLRLPESLRTLGVKWWLWPISPDRILLFLHSAAPPYAESR